MSQDICSICMEKKEKDIKILKCNHSFHDKCVNEWLLANITCPLCRNEEITRPNNIIIEVKEEIRIERRIERRIIINSNNIYFTLFLILSIVIFLFIILVPYNDANKICYNNESKSFSCPNHRAFLMTNIIWYLLNLFISICKNRSINKYSNTSWCIAIIFFTILNMIISTINIDDCIPKNYNCRDILWKQNIGYVSIEIINAFSCLITLIHYYMCWYSI
jgi:hypothetical protein